MDVLKSSVFWDRLEALWAYIVLKLAVPHPGFSQDLASGRATRTRAFCGEREREGERGREREREGERERGREGERERGREGEREREGS